MEQQQLDPIKDLEKRTTEGEAKMEQLLERLKTLEKKMSHLMEEKAVTEETPKSNELRKLIVTLNISFRGEILFPGDLKFDQIASSVFNQLYAHR